ncbi:MAG TPA: UDP-N-acetylmuramoyl-L-alanyl-D-glutamate--2,6-diaminopimelate ligase [Clostridia bacterium]|nr:UDP-N-acetylmuramoyl-L-alanyl-D-glutamate--2,6-diaminopimelate ligase [Clostridia bacterium]
MKRLDELLDGILHEKANIDSDILIENLTIKIEEIQPNTLYFCLKDDAESVKNAVRAGASVIVAQKGYENAPCVIVDDIRTAMSAISSDFFENAHKKLTIIGAVGTNGKTTTTHIMAAILRQKGHKTAIIGTLGAELEGEKADFGLTTPDPIPLHRIFAKCVEMGITHVVMEISAHAIFFKKLHGVKCDYVIFTNISQDHLDFFGDMRTYADTKLNFFTPENVGVAVVNADDIYASRLISDNKVFTLSYGLKNPSDVFAVDLSFKNGKTTFVANAFDKIFEVNIPLLGEFNVYNTLSAIAVAATMGIDYDTIITALEKLPEVPGRFNIIKSDITVIIDYAHTPDGLENVLFAIRKFADKDIITVFGCGGNRDKTKRPIMGEISAKYSNLTIITSDNPRMENPMNIINEIAEGHKTVNDNFIKVADRTKAINFAVRIAQKGDVILIAGKGAEPYIDERGTKRPYSDKQTAQIAIRRFRSDKVDN